jgi:hypothetical protein
VADSGALRTERYKRHKMGDHSLCRRACARGSVKITEVAAGSGEDLEPSAALRQLAAQLAAAYAADPGNAALARELRTTLLTLSSPREAAIQAELDAFIADLGRPEPYADDDS